jgi:hypothetical protein
LFVEEKSVIDTSVNTLLCFLICLRVSFDMREPHSCFSASHEQPTISFVSLEFQNALCSFSRVCMYVKRGALLSLQLHEEQQKCTSTQGVHRRELLRAEMESE